MCKFLISKFILMWLVFGQLSDTVMCCITTLSSIMNLMYQIFDRAEKLLLPSEVIAFVKSQHNKLNKYHCVTVFYIIQYCNILSVQVYREREFVTPKHVYLA